MLTPQDCEDIEQFVGRLWGLISSGRATPNEQEAHGRLTLVLRELKSEQEARQKIAEAHSLCHPKIAQLEAQISHPLPPLDPSQVENEQR